MNDQPFIIVFAIYPGMTHLDFTGPHQFLSKLPASRTIVASLAGGTVPADGLAFAGTVPLASVERCDLLCVPGGTNATEVALDEAFIAQLQRLAAGARYVTSVCTGSLILGAAGLLRGKRAATHWSCRDLLPLYGAIPVNERVVRDGNVITGGGVTAGIDFALTVAIEVVGEAAAQTLQLALEYAPAPPLHAGLPETAPPPVLARYREIIARSSGQRLEQARAAAARLG